MFAAPAMKPGILLLLAAPATASLVLYGLCQTRCNMFAMACYGAAGATFGTVVASPLTPPFLLACMSMQGTCMSVGCAPLLLIPLP